MNEKELEALKQDAEKWRDWTSGKYRLVCKEKYVDFVNAYRTLQKIRETIPPLPWHDANGTLIKIRQTLDEANP